MNKGTKILLALVISFGVAQVCWAQQAAGRLQDKKKPSRFSELKEIQGVVSWISKRYIAVVFKSDDATRSEEEMLLPFDKDLKFEHRKNLGEISVGDTVAVQYEEVTQDSPDGAKTNRQAKKVIFIRAAVKKPDTTGALQSGPVVPSE